MILFILCGLIIDPKDIEVHNSSVEKRGKEAAKVSV
jgi:hypothetical protein